MQAKIRKFAREQNIPIDTRGVCHQVLAEEYIKPGDLILGADSHTPTGGALGAAAIGVGSTDIAIAMATGKCWLKVPETIRINIEGKMPKGVFAKDIILKIAKDLGPEGATYKVIEFGGEVIRRLDVSARLTLTNMAAELGAKTALVEPDQKTLNYLAKNNRPLKLNIKNLHSDKNCHYEKVLNYNVSRLTPQIAKPHEINNVSDARQLAAKKIKLDQIFIGSCTNCRIEDLEIVYNCWQNRKLAKNVRVIITPASQKIWEEASRKGYLEYFSSLGAIVTNPGCGACLGRHGGVLGDNEVCLATSNRNFKGRMGSPSAKIYLASPATAAASAISGHITDPRKYL